MSGPHRVLIDPDELDELAQHLHTIAVDLADNPQQVHPYGVEVLARRLGELSDTPATTTAAAAQTEDPWRRVDYCTCAAAGLPPGPHESWCGHIDQDFPRLEVR